jgi:hypothetical protein
MTPVFDHLRSPYDRSKYPTIAYDRPTYRLRSVYDRPCYRPCDRYTIAYDRYVYDPPTPPTRILPGFATGCAGAPLRSQTLSIGQ